MKELREGNKLNLLRLGNEHGLFNKFCIVEHTWKDHVHMATFKRPYILMG